MNCDEWNGRDAVTAVLAVILGCTGCGHRPAPDTSIVQTPPQFSLAGEATVPSRWWDAFNDRRLTNVVDAALIGNFDLESAWQRLQAAEAVARGAGAERKPDTSGTAEADYTVERGDTSTKRIGLGLAATYELDLWGQLNAKATAEKLRAEAARSAYQTIIITLSAQTAIVWFRLIDSQARMELLEKQLEANKRVLRLLEARLGSGLGGGVDVLRQRQLVAATRQQLNDVETERALLVHQLNVLQGRPPRTGVNDDQLSAQLPTLPKLPKTGVPAELVQRRPDTQAAFLELQAANRDLAAAVSNRYPRLSFDVSLSTLETDAMTLFEEWALGLSSNLTAPLLDFGRRKAAVDRAEADEQELLYTYGQAVLTAFKEVEDALLRETRQRKQIHEIAEQVTLAERTHEQLQVEYQNGVSDFIDVLEAETALQRLQRQLLTARKLALEYRVALYRALAGGIETL